MYYSKQTESWKHAQERFMDAEVTILFYEMTKKSMIEKSLGINELIKNIFFDCCTSCLRETPNNTNKYDNILYYIISLL